MRLTAMGKEMVVGCKSECGFMVRVLLKDVFGIASIEKRKYG